MSPTPRRDFLKNASLLGSFAMMGAPSFAAGSLPVVEEALAPQQPEATPQHKIKFAVCGMSHDHIYGMIGAIQHGGGELVMAWGGEEDKLANFRKRFPDVKIVSTQKE